MKSGSVLQSAPKADAAPNRSAFVNWHRHSFLKQLAGGHDAERLEKKETSSPNRALLQRSAVNQATVTTVPPIVHDVLRSPGQPLDSASRSFFEHRLGHDFSAVRIHTGPREAESAGAVNALAYTVGRDIVFGAGQYSPGTNASQRLLGHELTHVIQQSGRAPSPLTVSAPGDPFEREADRTAFSLDAESSSLSIRSDGVGLMRQPAEHHAGEKKPGAEAESDDVKELKDKVGKLVAKAFQGDLKKAFDHYDADHDGAVDAGEIEKLLEDANVGNFVTRGKWVSGILAKMDTNKDGKITWSEFESGIRG
jgi:hypothetical protein